MLDHRLEDQFLNRVNVQTDEFISIDPYPQYKLYQRILLNRFEERGYKVSFGEGNISYILEGTKR